MATEFYLLIAAGTSKTAPVGGKISLIVGNQNSQLRFDSATGPIIYKIPTSLNGGDAIAVIPTAIPVRSGQIIYVENGDVNITVTGQGA